MDPSQSIKLFKYAARELLLYQCTLGFVRDGSPGFLPGFYHLLRYKTGSLAGVDRQTGVAIAGTSGGGAGLAGAGDGGGRGLPLVAGGGGGAARRAGGVEHGQVRGERRHLVLDGGGQRARRGLRRRLR